MHAEVGRTVEDERWLGLAILASDDEFVIVCDRASTVLLCSRQAASLLAATADSPLGRPLQDTGLFGGASGRVAAALKSSFAEGAEQRLEVEWTTHTRSRVLGLRVQADAERGRALVKGARSHRAAQGRTRPSPARARLPHAGRELA